MTFRKYFHADFTVSPNLIPSHICIARGGAFNYIMKARDFLVALKFCELTFVLVTFDNAPKSLFPSFFS